MSGDGWGSSFGCIAPKTEVEVPDTILFHNGSEFKFIGKATDKIRSFELTDPVPLDGEPLQPKTPWIGVDLASKPDVSADWAAPVVSPHIIAAYKEEEKEYTDLYGTEINPVALGLKEKNIDKVPTHDPYTNPNAQLYYSCNCGAIFDPGTKRFAELNNCASKAGWKIRFTDTGYVPYCVDCGKGVE